jgi:succinoglycan biosynthesis protein ExoV
MKIYYWQGSPRNFGDELNPWLWPRIAPRLFDGLDDGLLFVGFGTILNDSLPLEPLKIVFGSGFGYGQPPLDPRWLVYCVRGPLTAQALGLDPVLAITDPAILIRPLAPDAAVTSRVAFMPHHRSALAADWQSVCREAGVAYVDPGAKVETVLAAIRCAELLVTEAMHGAIVAEAFRVPWIPVRAYPWILHFKWEDWCRSLDLSYRPVDLPTLWDPGFARAEGQRVRKGEARLRTALRPARWRLRGATFARRRERAVEALARIDELEPVQSDKRVVERAIERLHDALARLERDLPALRADSSHGPTGATDPK